MPVPVRRLTSHGADRYEPERASRLERSAGPRCGYSGNDTIYGGRGGDLLYGEADNDHLFGGPGGDELHGGAGGNDRCDGGPPDRSSGGEADRAFTCEQVTGARGG